MSSFSDRRFWMLEGFGYSTSAQMKSIHTSFNGTVEIDRTTIPGRNCVSISSGGYIDIVNPRYDSYPWAETSQNSTYMQVMQAKVYLDSDTYANLLVNSSLMEMWAGPDRRFGFGISPNTSINQDNWYIRSYDSTSDIAIMTPAYVPPAIPQKTLVDIKVMLYNDGQDDGVVLVFANNFLIAHTLYYGVGFGNGSRRFRGVRLYGLANQSGPTLWSDVMVYGVPNDYRHNARGFIDHIYQTGTVFTPTLWGNVFVPMSARVLDITPTTTDNATNQFVTIGTGNAITALSGIDTNQYVTSSAAGQAFRLKVGEPDEATGDGSTPITVTDDSEVLAVQYRMYGKDLGGVANPVSISMEDNSLTNYQYRYYKLRASEITREDAADGYLQRIAFLDAAGNRLAPPVGATMRLNNVNEIICPEYAFTRASNTAVHTPLLGTSNVGYHYYYTLFDFSGVRPVWNRAYWVFDWIIDMGIGNVGPDWYRLRMYQSGYADRLFNNWSLYGSDDGTSWVVLGDTMGQFTNDSQTDIINRRHPSYPPGGNIRNLVGFTLNASQYEQLSVPYTGDPFCAGLIDREPRTPTPWRQFKNYKIGFNES